MTSIDISNIIDTFKKQCSEARSEEDDIRALPNIFFNSVGNALGLYPFIILNEITSAFGGSSMSSIYNNIYFEYKNLNLFSKPNSEGIKEAVYGRDNKDHGLFHYLVNFALEESHEDVDRFLHYLTSSVGVGFLDGSKICLLPFQNSAIRQQMSIIRIRQKISLKISPHTFNVEFERSSLTNLQMESGVFCLYFTLYYQKKNYQQKLYVIRSKQNQIFQSPTIVYLRGSLLECSLKTNSCIKTPI